MRHLRHSGDATAPFPRTFWSVPPIRWRTADLTIAEPSSFRPAPRRASKSDWAAAGWRFSISLRSGHQPMQDAETGNWIVYNGEIYNFRELRTRLQGEGVRFVSQSDTEVLLKAYGRWGEKCLGELRGMFAFAIWDAKRSRLLLGRDPMGIKPLYYCSAGQYFLFASELRTLLGTGLVPRRLDPAGLINYLNFGSVYDPITMIQGVSALEAGHYAVWENGQLTDAMYWDLAPHGRAGTASSYLVGNETARKDLENDVYATLDQAVRMQTVSDVPVGLFLSGGIDSSSLAGILSRAGIRLNTFSIIFREAEYSEAEYSRAVARAFATEHQEIMVSQGDVLDAIPYALKAMDQPTIDGLNTYLIARQTRAAGIKVALSGLGGDELFAGYSTFRDVPRMERFARFWGRWPSILRRPAGAYVCFAGFGYGPEPKTRRTWRRPGQGRPSVFSGARPVYSRTA